jgi:hypothetical protein
MFHPVQKVTILLIVTSAIALVMSPAVANTFGRMTWHESAISESLWDSPADQSSHTNVDINAKFSALVTAHVLEPELTIPPDNLEDLATANFPVPIRVEILPPVESQVSPASFLSDSPASSSHQLIAQSAPSDQLATDKKWGVGVHAQAGTLGLLGVDAGYRLSPNFNARVGINTVGTGLSYSNSGVNYQGNWQPTNVHLLGDYFPFGGNSLRLTGGFVAQNNRINGTAQSSGGNINLNGVDVPAADAGTISADGGFGSSIAPYLGIGYGSPISPGISFNADLGVMFPGSPSVKLSRSGGIASTDIDNQLAQQEQRTNNDLKGFNAYPFLSIGFSYAF